jgi:hypothetical protein
MADASGAPPAVWLADSGENTDTSVRGDRVDGSGTVAAKTVKSFEKNLIV